MVSGGGTDGDFVGWGLPWRRCGLGMMAELGRGGANETKERRVRGQAGVGIDLERFEMGLVPIRLTYWVGLRDASQPDCLG